MVGVQWPLKGEFSSLKGHAQDNWYQVPLLSYHHHGFAALYLRAVSLYPPSTLKQVVLFPFLEEQTEPW